MRRLPYALILAASLCASAAAAAPPFDFFARGPYRAGVPRPADVLGYDIGSFHTNFGNMERYVDAVLRAAPDRVVREPFGRTVEFRERAVLIISSPENLARLAEIRDANAALADPRRTTPAQAAALAARMPVTVWLNYSIHGDESASFEAMPYVVYQLVAGEDSMSRAIRANCVTLVNLAHNPDGHERFVTWVNALGQGNPEPWAIEQQREQPWGIGGRATHYQFDPNRDALAMSQPESRQSSREIRRWRPQVLVDHHGQVASFFFPPNAPVENSALSDGIYRKWTALFGRGNADAFDRQGWSYYVRDYFDFHAPQYWDVWPSLTGAIGMTYETNGGGNFAIRRDDGTILTMRDGAARHFTASLATLQTAVEHRRERLADFYAFAQGSVRPPADGTRAYVVDPSDDPLRAAELVENLLHAGIEVRHVARAFTLKAARPLFDEASRPAPAKAAAKEAKPAKDSKDAKDAKSDAGAAPRIGMPRPAPAAAAARTFATGAFVVDLAQPASRVARAILEADASADTAFVRQELDKYTRNISRGRRTPGEDYGFYDLTAWALPLSYGVRVYSTGDAPPDGALLAVPDPVGHDEAEDLLPDSLAIGIPLTARTSRVGPLVLRDTSGAIALDLRGRVVGGEARTAYVWSSATEGSARLALRLMQEDFRVATSTRPLRVGEREFPRGSFIARVERNPGALHARIATLAAGCGVTVLSANSAWIDRGDTGLGSETIESLKKPRIGIVVDEPVSPNAYGWLWFLFERRLGVRFTAVRAGSIGSVDLERYNVLIIPDGNGGALAGTIGDGGIGALKGWIGRGGALICLDDASEFPTLASVGLSSARVVGVKAASADKPKDDDAEPDSAEAEAARRPQFVPGTIFRASVDPRHFLGYGIEGGTLPVLVQGRTFLRKSRDGANPLVFDRVPMTIAGWTWPETERRLQGTAYAIDEPNGRGHVVMITGSPAFRAYWRSTERLLLNAVIYAPARD